MSMKFASFVLVILLAGCASSPSKKDEAATDDQQQQAAVSTNEQPMESSANAGVDPQLQGFYKHGLILLKSKSYKPALTHWLQLSVKYPDYPGIWVNLALAQYYTQNYQDAQSSLEKAHAINSEFCPTFAVSGLVSRELGEFSKSETSYLNAIACDSSNPDLHRNLGILYDLYLRKYDQAVKQYKLAKAYSKVPDPNLDIWIKDLETRYGLTPQEPAAPAAIVITTEPAAETPAAETPAAETPAAETPAAETPAAEPAAETPAAEESADTSESAPVATDMTEKQPQ
jgi:tetratricopeptide (TPR) repeat protein